MGDISEAILARQSLQAAETCVTVTVPSEAVDVPFNFLSGWSIYSTAEYFWQWGGRGVDQAVVH